MASKLGFLAGFITCAPGGPINVTIVNEGALRGFLWAFFIGLGAIVMEALYCAAAIAGFAGIFGKITSAYFQRYGDKSDALAKIAVKAHRNGAKNPFAHFQKEFAYDFCRNPSDKNPFVAGPLKRTDCSPVTDGAAAVVLADVGTTMRMTFVGNDCADARSSAAPPKPSAAAPVRNARLSIEVPRCKPVRRRRHAGWDVATV